MMQALRIQRIALITATLVVIGCGNEPVGAQDTAREAAKGSDRMALPNRRSYTVYDDYLSNPRHKGARVSVYRTAFGRALSFQEANGDGYVCDNAIESLNGSVSCARKIDAYGADILETLSVASLASNFCRTLQDHPDDKIKRSIRTNCPGGSTCICYRVEWRCFDEETDSYKVCEKLAGEDDMPQDDDDFRPPTRGTGSGGSP